jgi:hypothetical protein
LETLPPRASMHDRRVIRAAGNRSRQSGRTCARLFRENERAPGPVMRTRPASDEELLVKRPGPSPSPAGDQQPSQKASHWKDQIEGMQPVWTEGAAPGGREAAGECFKVRENAPCRSTNSNSRPMTISFKTLAICSHPNQQIVSEGALRTRE